MAKRKPAKKTRAKPARVFSTSKRRGKDIFDIRLPNAYRVKEDITQIINKAKLNIPSDLIEGGQVKVTLIAKHYSNYASITLIHDIDDKIDLRDSVHYTLDWIFRKLKPGEVVKNKNPKYLSPGNPLNNYINRMVIDFETND